MIEGTGASKHLEMGDRVLRINGKDLSSVSDAEWCKIWEEESVDKSEEQINITILRNGEEYQFDLEKTLFF